MLIRGAALGLMAALAPLAAWSEDGCNLLYAGQVSALSADGSWLAAAGEAGGKLFADTQAPVQGFGGGAAVSIHGDLMAVGTPAEGGTGVVHLYQFLGQAWQPVGQPLQAPGVRPGARFGAAVALGARWLVAGAPEDGSAREGVAYVFSRQTRDLVKILHPGDGRLNDRFGTSVAVHEDTIVVGAPYADDLEVFYNFGAAYVFEGSWEQPVKLQAADSFRPGDIQFGTAVAIGENRIVAGAPGDDPSDVESAGSAYLFIRENGGWSRRLDLLPRDSSPSPGRQLGLSVDVDGGQIAVGAVGDGAAYYFALDGTPAGKCGCGGHFGRSVALWKDVAFLSGPDGVGGCFVDPPAVENTLSVLCGEIEGSRRQQSRLAYNFFLQGGPGQTGAIRGELIDALPANLPLLGASATSGQIHAGASKATWKGEVGEGETVGVRIQARIWMAAVGTKLCNQAKVSYDSDGDGVLDASVLSDDPNVPGAADACCFTVLPAVAVEGIPTLSDVALAALALFLAALSIRRLRAGPVIPSGGR